MKATDLKCVSTCLTFYYSVVNNTFMSVEIECNIVKFIVVVLVMMQVFYVILNILFSGHV